MWWYPCRSGSGISGGGCSCRVDGGCMYYLALLFIYAVPGQPVGLFSMRDDAYFVRIPAGSRHSSCLDQNELYARGDDIQPIPTSSLGSNAIPLIPDSAQIWSGYHQADIIKIQFSHPHVRTMPYPWPSTTPRAPSAGPQVASNLDPRLGSPTDPPSLLLPSSGSSRSSDDPL